PPWGDTRPAVELSSMIAPCPLSTASVVPGLTTHTLENSSIAIPPGLSGVMLGTTIGPAARRTVPVLLNSTTMPFINAPPHAAPQLTIQRSPDESIAIENGASRPVV